MTSAAPGRLEGTTHTPPAPDATLGYEVLGSGPVLVLIGHPMSADGLRPLAQLLAAEHTVVLHDPRGTGTSPMTDPTEPPDADVLADDLSRVLAASAPPAEDDLRSMTRMVLGIETMCTYRVDGGALPTGRVRIGVGATSGDELTARTSRASSATLGLPLDVFPGGTPGSSPTRAGTPTRPPPPAPPADRGVSQARPGAHPSAGPSRVAMSVRICT